MDQFFPVDCRAYFEPDFFAIAQSDNVQFENEMEKELQRIRSTPQGREDWHARMAELGDSQRGILIERVFLSWLHQIGRSIAPVPRTVENVVPAAKKIAHRAAISEIEGCFRFGLPLRDRASRDAQRGCRLADSLKDFLWRDWQVVHLHLAQGFSKPNVRLGTKSVLLVHVDWDTATLLDVVPHDFRMTETALLRLLKGRPSLRELFKLKGVLCSSQKGSLASAQALAKRGVNSVYELDGDVMFQLGMGTTTSGHAMRLSVMLDRLMHAAHRYAQQNGGKAALSHLRMGFDGAHMTLGYRAAGLTPIYRSRPIA